MSDVNEVAAEQPDVLIIGAGVMGTSIAMALSYLDIRVAVVERRHDVGEEASRANSGITNAGWSMKPGTLEADLVKASSPQWERLCEQLGVRFRRTGLTLLAFSEDDVKGLPALLEKAESNEVAAEIVTGAELHRVAPHASPEAKAGLFVPAEGVVDSVRLPVAYAELAERNGVRFFLGESVISSTVRDNRVQEVITTRRRYRPRFVVNAAGVSGDEVSGALHGDQFPVTARRGQWVLLDREFGANVPSILTGMPTKMGHGPMVIPTAHGSVLIGPDAEDLEDKQDRSTTRSGIEEVVERCRVLMPTIDTNFAIKAFAGLRPHSDPTYRVGWAKGSENLLQVAGIRSTGVSSSPAMGTFVRDLLVDAGLSSNRKRDAYEELNFVRPLWWDNDWARQASDPLGRTVICACEKVTALDIHQALRDPLPAKTIGGVARRTHASWGRCQGSACLSGVAFITSLYREGDAWETPMHEPGSSIGVGVARNG
ncbi:NAD(P)/FAD-dependent oxidoreductase [Tessaracoccus lubricantis]|uniref:NAD(P)/FAD-dependent oxidoreductase n=1 Tax=Tessaracoccus lubricantis TaxID=545543 RepID=A0ABP9FU26_9ACTN